MKRSSHLVGLVAVVVAAASACAATPGAGPAPAAAPAAGGAPAAAAAPRALGGAFRDCDGCPEMVVVPPGSFTMGRDDGEPERYEGPVRRVTIGYAFALGRVEVTTAQYREFARATGRPATTGCWTARDRTYVQVEGTSWEDPGYGRPVADDEPAACLTWLDAKAYVDWLAARTGQPYRLPTEAEWEYAARGGRTGFYPWGDDPAQACREANVYDRLAAAARPLPIEAAPCEDGYPGIAPVGRFAANPFGLHDMAGNVWEWVQDCYAMPHPADAPADGSAQVREGCDRRGVRGGSWITTIQRQRPTFRGRDPEAMQSQIFGMRVARDLPAAR